MHNPKITRTIKTCNSQQEQNTGPVAVSLSHVTEAQMVNPAQTVPGASEAIKRPSAIERRAAREKVQAELRAKLEEQQNRGKGLNTTAKMPSNDTVIEESFSKISQRFHTYYGRDYFASNRWINDALDGEPGAYWNID